MFLLSLRLFIYLGPDIYLVSKEFITWPTFAISVFIGIEFRFCEIRLI